MILNETPWEHRCPKCGAWKPATTKFFHKNKYGQNGLNNTCRDCRNEYMTQRRRDQKYNENTNQEEI